MVPDPIGIVTVVAACASLAQVAYRKCRDSRGEYRNLATQTRALHHTLEDLHDLVQEHQLTGHNEEDCWDRVRDCKEVLEDLEAAVDKYKALGERGNIAVNAWNGIRFDREAVQKLTDRLNTSVTLLNAFYSSLILSSQIRIEKALYDLFEKFQKGFRDTKSVSRLTSTEAENDDPEAWEMVVADLEDSGLDKETAEDNKLFIVDWLVHMMPAIVIEDPNPDEAGPPGEPGPSNEPGPPSNESRPVSSSPRLTQSSLTHRPISMNSDGTSLVSPSSPARVSLHQRLLEPFGKTGALVEERVKRGENTFKDDLNRAREYWKRRNWFEVKRHVLYVLVASQLPTHRRLDIRPRTAAFLSGVTHSYSGDLETAKSIFLAVLTPVEANPVAQLSNEYPVPVYDDGQIAAATWLGDVCIKTYRLETAAFAWALAFDAVLRKAQDRDRPNSGAQLSDSAVALSPSAPSASAQPPPVPPRLHPVRSTGRDFLPQHIETQTRVILRRLAYCHRKTNNLNSLLESLESNWDLDGDESIFSYAKLMSTDQMIRIARLAKNAVERADSSLFSDGLVPRARGRSAANTQQPSFRSSTELNPVSSTPEPLVSPAEDFLTSPVRSSGWPLEWDNDFSAESAYRTIDWYFSFTELSGEGVLHNLQTHSADYAKEHETLFSDNFEEKESERFIATLKKLIKALGFEYREQPGAFRCRNKTDTWSRFASIAYFELHIFKFRARFRRMKFAAYICNILHWNNVFEEKKITDIDSKNMLKEMQTKVKIYEAEHRGQLLPTVPGA